MDVFFNEKCFGDLANVDPTLYDLHQELKLLDKAKVNVYTCLNEIHDWYNTMSEYFDSTSRKYFMDIIKLFAPCVELPSQHFYQYITHQTYTLTISDIYPSSIAIAAEKILSNQQTVVLNLPQSNFSHRPYLSILKSPYNAKNKDTFANVPCFDEALKITKFILLQEKVKAKVDVDKFENFYDEYFDFLNNFDFTNWKPHIVDKNDKLIPVNSFPICKIKIIAEEIASWEIKDGSYGDNSAQYKFLGDLVLQLNRYERNDQLSSHYKRDIYEAGCGNHKLLISLDRENGLFEVIDNHGVHIGSYNYTGERKGFYVDKDDIAKHSLHDIPRNMFLFK